MATFNEDFESGTNGATITGNVGSGTMTGSGTATYSTEQAAHGGKSMKLAQATAGRYIQPSWSASAATRWYRQYLFMGAAPSASTTTFAVYDGATLQGHWRVTTGRQIQLRNTSSTQVALSSTALAVNQWHRIETQYAPGGTATVRIFSGSANMDNTVPTETISGAMAGTGSSTKALLGPSSAATWTTYWDDVAYSDSAWIGPAANAPFQGWGIPI